MRTPSPTVGMAMVAWIGVGGVAACGGALTPPAPAAATPSSVASASAPPGLYDDVSLRVGLDAASASPESLSSGAGDSQNQAILDVVAPGHPEAPGQAAYGYVVFRDQPDSADPRDKAICAALAKQLLTPADAGSGPLATTYWPAKESMAATRGTCDRLLDRYDRKFAERVARSLPEPAQSWRVFLVAQAAGAFDGQQPRETLVCLDLSDGEHIEERIDKWRRLMRGGASHWKAQGFINWVQTEVANLLGNPVHIGCK